MKHTRRKIIAVSSVLAGIFQFVAQPSIAWGTELDAAGIMTKNYSISRVEDSTFEATFTLINKQGNERVRKTAGSTKLQPNKLDQMRFTRFMAPPDVSGMSTLLVEHAEKDDDIWIYLPALKKVRRLSSDNKKDSFLGTDFSYADVIGFSVSNWAYSLLREETVDGEACYVISGTPKTAAVRSDTGYSKRIDWIRKSSLVAVRSEFWDESGQPLKNAIYSDIRLVDPKDGKWQAMRLEATNIQTGHRTIIKFDNFKVNQKVDAQVFTTRHMEKQ